MPGGTPCHHVDLGLVLPVSEVYTLACRATPKSQGQDPLLKQSIIALTAVVTGGRTTTLPPLASPGACLLCLRCLLRPPFISLGFSRHRPESNGPTCCSPSVLLAPPAQRDHFGAKTSLWNHLRPSVGAVLAPALKSVRPFSVVQPQTRRSGCSSSCQTSLPFPPFL